MKRELTQDILDKILKLTELGCPSKTAFKIFHITRDEYEKWIEVGETEREKGENEENNIYVKLVNGIEEKDYLFYITTLQAIKTNIANNGNLALQTLAKLGNGREDFKDNVNLDVSGDTITIVSNMPKVDENGRVIFENQDNNDQENTNETIEENKE